MRAKRGDPLACRRESKLFRQEYQVLHPLGPVLSVSSTLRCASYTQVMLKLSILSKHFRTSYAFLYTQLLCLLPLGKNWPTFLCESFPDHQPLHHRNSLFLICSSAALSSHLHRGQALAPLQQNLPGHVLFSQIDCDLLVLPDTLKKKKYKCLMD